MQVVSNGGDTPSKGKCYIGANNPTKGNFQDWKNHQNRSGNEKKRRNSALKVP